MAVVESTTIDGRLRPCVSENSAPNPSVGGSARVSTDAPSASPEETSPLASAPVVAQAFRPRRMTVSYIGADLPYLRLKGHWLYRAGFGVGTSVRVDVSEGRLVLEAVGPQERQRCAEAGCFPAANKKYPEVRCARRALASKSHPVKPRATTACYSLLEPAVAEALKEVLISARLRVPLSIRALARRAELRTRLIRALEEGRRLPTIPVFIVLAWSLDLDPRELLDRMLSRTKFPEGSTELANRALLGVARVSANRV